MSVRGTIMRDLVGKSVAEADRICADNGLTLRVVREDEIEYGVTMDYKTDRVNIVVKNGIVVAVNGRG
jgi:hypothetical protein